MTVTLRAALPADAGAIAGLHADRIRDGFLVTLGPGFLRRLYRRVVRSPRSFAIVATEDGRVTGFVAVAERTSALYREFLLRDGVVAGLSAIPGVVRAPRAVLETLRYGLRAGPRRDPGGPARAEILATAVAAGSSGRGIGARLVQAAVEELERRGITAARVVTATGNDAARRAYERGGFRRDGVDEVHRGVTQERLVWP